MDRQEGITKSTLSTTSTDKMAKIGRPRRTSAAPTPWSIRGVEPDTRRVIEKAAERVSKTIGQYLNEDVRGFAQDQLIQTSLPASPMDIQHQIDHLTKIVEGIAGRLSEPSRKSLWQLIFNR